MINQFEYKKKLSTLKSGILRRIAEHLWEHRYEITYFGQAWSNESSSWVYFNNILDIDRLKKDFDPADELRIHENLDPKSGKERGFIDKNTGEGLMGLC